jgi:hypothetical protein
MIGRSTRRDLLGTAAAAAAMGGAKLARGAAPNPDARLVALCADCSKIEAECRRLGALCDVPSDAWLPDGLEEAYDQSVADKRMTLDTIAALPASTPAGIQAKAQVIWDFFADDERTKTMFEQNYPIRRVLWSLVEDGVALDKNKEARP